MSRQEIVAMKLQMGINPLVKIDAHILLAMWQQLNRERNSDQHDGSPMSAIPYRLNSTPLEM